MIPKYTNKSIFTINNCKTKLKVFDDLLLFWCWWCCAWRTHFTTTNWNKKHEPVMIIFLCSAEGMRYTIDCDYVWGDEYKQDYAEISVEIFAAEQIAAKKEHNIHNNTNTQFCKVMVGGLKGGGEHSQCSQIKTIIININWHLFHQILTHRRSDILYWIYLLQMQILLNKIFAFTCNKRFHFSTSV